MTAATGELGSSAWRAARQQSVDYLMDVPDARRDVLEAIRTLCQKELTRFVEDRGRTRRKGSGHRRGHCPDHGRRPTVNTGLVVSA